MKRLLQETFAQLMERVKKLLNSPLCVKKLVKNLSGKDFHASRVAVSVKDDTNNNELLSAFFALIGKFIILFPYRPRIMQKSLLTHLLLIASYSAFANTCQPVDSGLLSADNKTRVSQLEDAWFECTHLTNAILLAKAYSQQGNFSNSDDIMQEALPLAQTEEQRSHWLVTQVELSLSANDTCAASSYLNELSAFKSKKHTYRELRRQLYEKNMGKTLSPKEISCGLKASRTVSYRSIGIRPRLDVTILFEFDSDVLTAKGRDQVRNLSESLSAFKDKKIMIIGHTDSRGSDEYNKTLSEKRSLSVKKYLQQLAPQLSGQLHSVGMGESDLLSAGTTEHDHQLNRRVEIRLEKK